MTRLMPTAGLALAAALSLPTGYEPIHREPKRASKPPVADPQKKAKRKAQKRARMINRRK